MSSSRLQTYLGLGLLIIAILAFFFNVFASLPKADEVNQVAEPLAEIPKDLFSGSNELSRQINALNVPSNVPVVVNPSNLGRSNVFQNY